MRVKPQEALPPGRFKEGHRRLPRERVALSRWAKNRKGGRVIAGNQEAPGFFRGWNGGQLEAVLHSGR